MGALKKRYQEMVAAADRLSHREKIMVAGVAIVFVIFVGTLVSMWVSSKLSNIERRVNTKTKSLQTMIDMRQQFEQGKASRLQIEKTINQARDIQLMGTLENLAKQLGIDTNDMEMSPRASSAKVETNLEEQKVEIKIPRITIDRLVEFLQLIEHRSLAIAVRKLQIRKNFKTPDRLDVAFTVSKFQLKNAPAAASPKADAKKSSQ